MELEGQLMELSFNAFFGIDSPTTTKMRGTIGKIDIITIVTLDNGVTHNSISSTVVEITEMIISIYCWELLYPFYTWIGIM